MSAAQGFSGAALLDEVLKLLKQCSGTTIAAQLAGTTVVLYLANTLYAWHRLSHVPGPFWAAFSKYWMVRESLKGQQPYAVQEVNEKYGETCS